MPPTSAEIRSQFIDFFVKKHAHTFVPSSPVVPHDDPTLLFTNAGMNQFKPYFLGTARAPWPRAANTQKCIRAGGKHNDLDDVGRSRRHHTFFEMLGNWSFGNYFKQGAIEMAWELLTQVWKLDPTRLHVSCYEGNEAAGIPRDTEAANIWKKVANLPDSHIHYFGKDNFWEMGDTGPCGPCTEIYYDRTPDKTGGKSVNGEDPRVMEIWNNVFIQYNRDASGKLTTLPAQHVDTGMGLERICQVLQNKDDNYATDLFTPLFDAISKISGHQYTGQFPPTNAADPALEAANPQLRIDIAFRVIADHLRCLTFALTDGATPSNEGRGYVLRRILRRAVRFGRQNLNLRDPFLHTLVPTVIETMGGMFPELKTNPQKVIDTIKDEEESFGRTLDRGIVIFDETAKIVELIASENYVTDDNSIGKPNWVHPGEVRYYVEAGKMAIPSATAFKLYDTFGFPIDLTRIMAEERGMTVDLAGYETLMEKAKERSRGVDKATGNAVYDLPPNILDELQKLHVHPTDDSHKFHRAAIRATVRAIWNGNDLDQSTDASDARPNEQVAVLLDKTNFYAEMGGQIGDSGELRSDSNGNHGTFIVETTRTVGHYTLHIGHIKSGKLTVGDSITAYVQGGRDRTEKNHTSTHLANWALRETLGEHVQQKGSLVDPDKLRFDFIHPKPLADEEIKNVEILVNGCIEQKLPVYAAEAPQEQALKILGLRAVFGEKYPPMVRVVSVGVPIPELIGNPADPRWRQYSIEFCGGTHLNSSAEAEHFVVTAEESVSKGIRRLVALTGPTARQAAIRALSLEKLLLESKSASDADLPGAIAELQKVLAVPNLPLLAKRAAQAAVSELQDRYKKFQRSQSSVLSTQSSGSAFDPESLLAGAESISGITLVVAVVPNASPDNLRATWDWLKKKHPQQNLAALLASESQDTDKEGNKLPPKANLLAAVGDPLVEKMKAGDWIKAVAPLIGGSGGGRPQLAMAGGKDPARIPEALEAAKTFARGKLS